jgi:hypothetical protein
MTVWDVTLKRCCYFIPQSYNIVTIYVCDYMRGINWWTDLLTTYTHHSELQVITVLLLISTIYQSLHTKSSPPCSVSNSCSLATASNSGDSSASSSQVLSSQPPVQNSTPNWQFPGWRPLHINLLVFSSQAEFQLTLCQLTTGSPPTVKITPRNGPHKKHCHFHCCSPTDAAA